MRLDSELFPIIYSPEVQTLSFIAPLTSQSGNFTFEIVDQNNTVIEDFSLKIDVLSSINDEFIKQDYIDAIVSNNTGLSREYKDLLTEYDAL